ncbi:MAG: peptidylprolyl isomerase [Erythrobacter sp.]|jgi:peptidylprolyl isomerase|nr:peptidylprolyl isomerase [Erythrobacter sp.]
MNRINLAAACALLAAALPLAAQDAAPALSPADIVNAAPQEDWVVIAPEDMLVMTLAPNADGTEREVVIQLMPPPFSQGWVENIRLLARSGWYEGTSINRVQDNYVTQWGDPNYDNPEAGGEAKPLPAGLKVMSEEAYAHQLSAVAMHMNPCGERANVSPTWLCDAYAAGAGFRQGWPMATDGVREWPVHCYGMVGVGRNLSPDTGSGAELYTVIGHAPRHLDRNIALVGRVIGGMEHLSSLPRGSGALGFYTAEEAGKRVPILSVHTAADLPEAERPLYEYLSTETETFARYAEARANRRDPFFIAPAGGADICNVPVPVRPSGHPN